MITFNSTFGMGKTRATLQASGKELIEIKLLSMCVRGEAMISKLTLSNKTIPKNIHVAKQSLHFV